MHTLALSICAALSLSALVPAQTQTAIYPRDHRDREGAGSNPNRHVTSGIFRIQYSYEGWNLDLPKGAKITAFGYRQDANYMTSAAKVEFEALMGHNSRLQEQLGTTFDLNYDSAATKVISKKTFDLPSMFLGSVPSKNFVMFKLDTPFAYQYPKNLVTELKVHGNDRGNKDFDYQLDYAYYHSPTQKFGTACQTSTAYFPDLDPTFALLGNNWNLYMRHFPGSAPTVLILGASKTKLFGTINLPFKLDALGMKGCFQHIDMNVVLPGINSDANGAGTIKLPVPLNFSLVGQMIYAQMWAVDLAANPAGLVTSNGAGVQFGAFPRSHMLYAPGSTTATSGYSHRDYGQVTRFDYQ